MYLENIITLYVLVEDGVPAQNLAGVVRGCVGQQLQPVLAALLWAGVMSTVTTRAVNGTS